MKESGSSRGTTARRELRHIIVQRDRLGSATQVGHRHRELSLWPGCTGFRRGQRIGKRWVTCMILASLAWVRIWPGCYNNAAATTNGPWGTVVLGAFRVILTSPLAPSGTELKGIHCPFAKRLGAMGDKAVIDSAILLGSKAPAPRLISPTRDGISL